MRQRSSRRDNKGSIDNEQLLSQFDKRSIFNNIQDMRNFPKNSYKKKNTQENAF